VFVLEGEGHLAHRNQTNLSWYIFSNLSLKRNTYAFYFSGTYDSLSSAALLGPWKVHLQVGLVNCALGL